MAQVGSFGGNRLGMWHRHSGVVLAVMLALPGCSGKVSTRADYSKLGPGETPDAGDPMPNPMGTGGSPNMPVGPGGSTPIGPGGTPNTPGYGPGGAMGIGGTSNPAATPETNALCSAWGHYDRTVLTEAEFKQKILGRWMLCGETSIFGTNEAGLEITADHTWYKLLATSGGVVRATEPSDYGTWEDIDTSSMNGPGWFQLNLSTNVGTVMVSPKFTESPVKMAVSNMAVYDAVYVREGQPVPAGVPETFGAAVPPPCHMPGPNFVAPATIAELEALLSGRWIACTLSPFRTDEIGIELAAGGVLHKLYAGPGDDVVTVGHGFGREGTWSILENTDGTDGWHQVDFYFAGVGTISSFPRASAGWRSLTFDNSGVTGWYDIAIAK